MQSIISESKQVVIEIKTVQELEASLITTAKTLGEDRPVFLISQSYNAVQVGAVLNGCLKITAPIDPQYLIDLRLFCSQGELHIWRIDNGLRHRVRIDSGDGQPNMWIKDEYHGMWGTEVEPDRDGWMLIEKRIKPIWVPFKAEPYMTYKVRNYFDFDEDGLACCRDARLCEFFYKNHQPVQWI